MTYLGFSDALYMPLLLFFTQYILRLLDTANIEFHFVIYCDPYVDRQIHTYLNIACISDNSVKSDLKIYLSILIQSFVICRFFREGRTERNTVA